MTRMPVGPPFTVPIHSPQNPDARAPDYRAYIIDIDGHRFLKAARFLSDHPDDATAIAAAKTLVKGHDVELWDGSRFVARLSPERVEAPQMVPPFRYLRCAIRWLNRFCDLPNKAFGRDFKRLVETSRSRRKSQAMTAIRHRHPGSVPNHNPVIRTGLAA